MRRSLNLSRALAGSAIRRNAVAQYAVQEGMANGTNGTNGTQASRLDELCRGEMGVLASIDLPADLAERLMVMGFLPGAVLSPAQSAPGGDPRVYRVDGAEVALRRETAQQLMLEPASSNGAG